MYAKAFLCFLLMIQNVCLAYDSTRAVSGAGIVITTSRCEYEKIIADELMKWKTSDKFKYYLPKRSCLVCSNIPCKDTCDKWVTKSTMNMYNNLFEVGLFAFNMAETNVFRIILNSMCYFKIEIIPDKTDYSIVEIYFSECSTAVLNEEKCTEKYKTNTPGSYSVDKDCIFIAFAFVEKQKLHYSISFQCTVIPSLLLNQNRSINISSNCYIEKGKKEQKVEFQYNDKKGLLVNGIAILLPCTTGGYAFEEHTGHIITGETCELFMKDKTYVNGMEFLIKDLYKGNESFQVESRPKGWNEKDSKDPTKKYKPTYLDDNDEWRSQVKMTQIRKEIQPPNDTVRQGCKLVDAKSVKVPKGSTTKAAPLEQPPQKDVAPLDNQNFGLKTGDKESKKNKEKKTIKKPKITGLGGISDSSRGFLHFVSIKMKLITLAINLGIIYHL